MANINVRSPYWVTKSSSSEVTLKLWLYEGIQSADPTLETPTYTLTSTPVNGVVAFDISLLAKDYYPENYVSLSYDDYDNKILWLDYQLDSDAFVQNRAYLGYGYFEDDDKPDVQGLYGLSTNKYIISKDELSFLPLYYDGANTLNFKIDGTTVKSVTTTEETSSYNGIGYTKIPLGNATYLNRFADDEGNWATSGSGTIYPEDDWAFLSYEVSPSSISLYNVLISGQEYSIDYEIVQSVGGAGGNALAVGNTVIPSSIGRHRENFTADSTTLVLQTPILTLGYYLRIHSVTANFTGLYAEIGTERIDFEQVCESKYTPYRISFINKKGVIEDVWFFKNSKLSLETKEEGYRANLGTSYATNQHQYKTLYKEGKESLTINSGFYPEAHNEVFKQLLLSEKVWINYKGQTLPCKIKDSSMSFKTQVQDKLINYTMNIEFAFDKINNVR